jgi:hypothetical protein
VTVAGQHRKGKKKMWETHRRRKQGDLIRHILFFENKERLKMDLQALLYEDMDWFYLTQNGD